MFWIGLGVGLTVGCVFGIFLIALGTAGKIED